MKEQSLTESAALVLIVKQFFCHRPKSQRPQRKDDAIAELKTDIAELKRHLMVLEQAVVSANSDQSPL